MAGWYGADGAKHPAHAPHRMDLVKASEGCVCCSVHRGGGHQTSRVARTDTTFC